MIQLQPDEKIVMKARRHWFVVFSEIVAMFFMLLVPAIAFYLISNSGIVTIRGNTTYLALAVESMWALFVWLMFSKFWVNYYLDVWVITNKRLIDIEQKGFFHREVSTLNFENIEDISVTIKGIIPTFLKFGEIRVQTAAESREFVMLRASNPTEIKNTLLRLIDLNKQINS